MVEQSGRVTYRELSNDASPRSHAALDTRLIVRPFSETLQNRDTLSFGKNETRANIETQCWDAKNAPPIRNVTGPSALSAVRNARPPAVDGPAPARHHSVPLGKYAYVASDAGSRTEL